jgi:hypothetical protein
MRTDANWRMIINSVLRYLARPAPPGIDLVAAARGVAGRQTGRASNGKERG